MRVGFVLLVCLEMFNVPKKGQSRETEWQQNLGRRPCLQQKSKTGLRKGDRRTEDVQELSSGFEK